MGTPIYAPVLNVKSYGAIGNGLADDTNAINRAAAEMVKAANGRLVFPKGSYRITSPIYFPNLTGMVVQGDGARHGMGKAWDEFACGTTIMLTSPRVRRSISTPLAGSGYRISHW